MGMSATIIGTTPHGVGSGDAKGITQKGSVVIMNATGATGEKNIWGKPAKWCDISGKIEGRPYGIAILDHPSNPRHPSNWHVREYGLMGANVFGLHDFDKKNPPGTGDFRMEKGKPATAFLLELIARLQATATVPMIDVRAYTRWLTD